MACDDRQLTQAQRAAAFGQQRTGVIRAVRPFSGAPTVENLIDYVNRELGPAVRQAREAVNDVYLQVADNAPSANPLAFYFSTSIVNADPTVGRIRLNASPQNTATVLRVSQTNGRLVDVLPWLDVMSGGPTTPLGVVTLVDAINPKRFIRWDLNTMTDQGAYWDLGLTVIESSDPDPFVEDEAVVISFISGVSAAGSTIPIAALSPIAPDTFVGNIGVATAPPVAVPLANVDSTSVIYDAATHTFQRAALTGFAVATQNSNATTSAEPIVTYSASANMSAERVTTSSTSVTVSTAIANQIEFQRAALTGEATALANANAVTVTRSTNFQTTPWTGDHQFNAELRLGTLHTENSAVGALNITLTAGATRVLINSTGNVTLGTISGAADGRVLILEHVRSSGAGNITITHSTSANGVACPLAEDFILGNRCSIALVGRGTTWRAIALPEHGKLIQVTEYTAGTGTHAFNSRATSVYVEGAAGGGGGGGAEGALGAYRFAAGGQAGESQTLTLISHTLSSGAYSIGAAGVGGVGTTGLTANATDGGDTTLNVVVSLTGGRGAQTRTTGGTAAEINLALHDATAGMAGSEGLTFGATGPGKSGTGGSTAFGTGGGPRSLAASTSGAQSGITANGPGAGGGGGYAANTTGDANGGDGFRGFLRIWEFS